jgi:hypothetical protein
VAVNTQDITNDKIGNFWRDCYVGIERANLLIANIDNAKVNVVDSVRASYLAEAKFMRGYYHFLLVQYFGGVPIKISPSADVTNTAVPRNTIKDVYDQILKDMTEAEVYLSSIKSAKYNGGNSRISKTAAQGILARVCLYMAGEPLKETTRYNDALVWAEKVQASNIHSLLTNADTLNVFNQRGLPIYYKANNGSKGNPAYKNNGYAQLFVNYATNIYSVKESMWEVDFFIESAALSISGKLGAQIGISNSGNDPVYGSTSSTVNAQQYLYKKYGEGDLRRDWAVAPYWLTGNSQATASRSFFSISDALASRPVGKWRREYEAMPAGYTIKPSWNTDVDFPLLRYSDVLLMLAEAEFSINGSTPKALEAINQVLRRGYGKDPFVADPTIDFATLTLADIQDERQRELCFEGNRKGDLIRWGIYLQRIKEVIQYNTVNSLPLSQISRSNRGFENIIAAGNKCLLWPIPAAEMLLNKSMVQNPNY